MLAATSNGIYKTTDGGNSWSKEIKIFHNYVDLDYKPEIHQSCMHLHPNLVHQVFTGQLMEVIAGTLSGLLLDVRATSGYW